MGRTDRRDRDRCGVEIALQNDRGRHGVDLRPTLVAAGTLFSQHAFRHDSGQPLIPKLDRHRRIDRRAQLLDKGAHGRGLRALPTGEPGRHAHDDTASHRARVTSSAMASTSPSTSLDRGQWRGDQPQLITNRDADASFTDVETKGPSGSTVHERDLELDAIGIVRHLWRQP